MSDLRVITLEQLFKETEKLSQCLQEAAAGRSAEYIAETLIEPVLGRLEANASQTLDPKYVAYMVIYASQSSSKK